MQGNISFNLMNRRGVTELNQGQLDSIICLSHLLPNSHRVFQYELKLNLLLNREKQIKSMTLTLVTWSP